MVPDAEVREASCPHDALWLAWRRGDPGAFEALYRDLSPGLHTLCRALARGTPIQADDLFQEAFRRAIASADRYRPGGSLAAWLSTIARNAFLDRMRSEARKPIPLPVAPAPEGYRDILDTLSSLPEALREAVALRHLQGLSLEETAEALGVSLATAKRRIAEGLEKLREMEKA